MSTQLENTCNQIIILSDKIHAYNIADELVRESELGRELNFKAIQPLLDKLFKYLDKVIVCNLIEIPLLKLNTFLEKISVIDQTLTNIKNFKTTHSRPTQARESYINTLRENIEQVVGPASEIIIFDAIINKDIALTNETTNNILNNVTSKTDSIIKASNEKLSELQNILESAKSAVGKIGVTTYTTLFEEESKMQKKNAENWFKAIIGFIIAIILSGILSLYLLPTDEIGKFYIIQYTITKVVILAAIFYVYCCGIGAFIFSFSYGFSAILISSFLLLVQKKGNKEKDPLKPMLRMF